MRIFYFYTIETLRTRFSIVRTWPWCLWVRTYSWIIHICKINFEQLLIVKAPKVDDDKAEFTYYIKNNGVTASVKCWTIAINAETNRGPYTERTIKIPGNGSVTTISYSYTPEQVGSNTMYGDIRLFNTETAEWINITSKIPNITYYLSQIGH